MKLMVATALCVCFATAPALAAEGQVPLTLAEAVRSAVEKNLDVKAELYNPAMAQADIRKNEGIYDTILGLNTDFNYSVTEPASTFLSGSVTNRQKTFSIDPGVSQLLPIGGTLGLTFNNTFNNNNSTISLNNYWKSDLTLSLTQPLLKNFGREPTELAIMVARNSKGESLERFRTKLSDTVARVRTEYFKLYSLREDLEVRKTSLLLARKILDDTKARVKAGVLPAMEILNAEFGVASREKDLIDAEKAVRDQYDVLRVLLQLPGREEIVPADLPTKDPLSVNEEEMIKRSLDNRPEIKEQRTALRSRELEMRVAHNRTLPDLNLSASAALTGLDRHYSRDLEKIGSTDYPVWGVGLQLRIPWATMPPRTSISRADSASSRPEPRCAASKRMWRAMSRRQSGGWSRDISKLMLPNEAGPLPKSGCGPSSRKTRWGSPPQRMYLMWKMTLPRPRATRSRHWWGTPMPLPSSGGPQGKFSTGQGFRCRTRRVIPSTSGMPTTEALY